MSKIKLGIIGFGNMGTGHTSNIMGGNCPEVELVAICDKNPARCEFGKNKYPDANITYFTDAIEMLDSGLIDSCLVAIPHYDHAKYSMECMKRGIHVMCEKPAGVYTRQVREMIAESEKHPEVVFGMMFNQRTDCVYRKLKELISSGEYGEIRRTNWVITAWYRTQAYYDSGDWRATWSGEGGGVLLNQCPHQLDLWQWICGMPKKVTSHVHYGMWHDIEVEDDVTIYVEYENGASGVFVTSTGDAHGTNRFEIQMDRAKFVVEGNRLYMEEYEMPEPEWTRTCKSGFETVPSKGYYVETDGESPQHVGVLNAWANAILNGGELVARGEEGINALTISNAAHLSSFLGREVEIPLDNDLFQEELMKRVATSRRKVNVNEVVLDTSNTYGGTK